MKYLIFKHLGWTPLLILVIILASCGEPSLTEGPSPSPTTVVRTVEPSPEPMETERSGQAVSNREEAKNAVIQIEADGEFVDPEFGVVSEANRGSGFIIDPSGIAVTNSHIVTGADLLKIWVGGDTGEIYNAKVLGVSECSDLAVIEIEGDEFPYFEWYEGPIFMGLEVYTLGFSLDETEVSMNRGVVIEASADSRSNWASVESVIGHDAPINPGNSGGPLVDEDGKVVGVNYQAGTDFIQYYAISSENVVPLVGRMSEGEDVNSIGVNGVALVLDDESISGVWVSSVESGSPADEAGLKGGDIITMMEGLSLAADGTMEIYCDILRSHSQNDELSIEVLRFSTEEVLVGQINGETLELAYSLAEPTPTEEGSEGDNTYVTVTDDSESIQMDIPSTWDQIDGSYWETTWRGDEFVAASITASSNLSAYSSPYYGVSGTFFAASDRLGQLGGYIQLLDGTKGWHDDYCDHLDRVDYDDGIYEGKYDHWINCGEENGTVYIYSVRPIDDPFAFLILVEVKVVTSNDIDALFRILQSFEVVGPLP